MMGIAWNSHTLEVAYRVLGWSGFFLWSCSFYPQLLLNFFRKSSSVRFQYHLKYGFDQMVPVAANDVAFSTHAVLLTGVLLFQCAIYERGNQSLSKVSIGIISLVWIIVAVCSFISLPTKSWLWLISIFNTMQVILAVIKYIPQAVMNFMRKSTDGFSIGNVLLDFSGGVTNYAQMVAQSIDQNSWVNFSGNIGKVLLSLVSVFFDVLFMCQHYFLYPSKKAASIRVKEPLIKSPLGSPVPLERV
ncbi:cystinosin homolog isoform X2 [Arachis duranensis]|uniref:Cystinosin homolog isoform X2 n=1 Tax=Arachis duranensis TaxID=130453 RepID=A0A6P4BR92_ARADU|nr:cystinosin homolog isoform X2 [Arachis duranensis]XP_025624513.1 cystinosin homolog isoform X2 [Arachis hypogaea]